MSGLAKAKELREQRAKLIAKAQEIQATAESRGEVMTSEEVASWDQVMADADQLKATYERLERMHDALAEQEESQGQRTKERGVEIERGVRGGVTDSDRADALRAWLMRGSDRVPGDEHLEAAQRCGVDVGNKLLEFNLDSRALRSLNPTEVEAWEKRGREQRQQSVGTANKGGFTVPDEAMQALEVAMLRFGGMREVADIIRTDSGADMPWPTVNDTTVKGRLLGENTQATKTDFTFGQLVLQAYKYSSDYVLVSVELLQDSAVNIAQFIGEGLGIRIGRITNEHFTTGDGSSKPQGIVPAATLGKTGGTGQETSVTYADLVDLQHSVDPEYRRNGRWMFADTTLRELKKLEDDNKRPLWVPGLAVREPDTILGHPYVVNQDVASMAADAKSILFGDLSKYKIRDVRNVTLLRLDERFADFHQVAFLAFSRHDGDLLDAGTNPVKFYANTAS